VSRRRIESVVTTNAHLAAEFRVVGDDHTPLAAGNRLPGVDTEAPYDSPGTCFSPIQLCPECTGCIFDDGDPEAPGDFKDARHVRRPAEGVNRHDRPHGRPPKDLFES